MGPLHQLAWGPGQRQFAGGCGEALVNERGQDRLGLCQIVQRRSAASACHVLASGDDVLGIHQHGIRLHVTPHTVCGFQIGRANRCALS